MNARIYASSHDRFNLLLVLAFLQILHQPCAISSTQKHQYHFLSKNSGLKQQHVKMWQKTGERKVEITFWTTFVCRLFACCFLGVGPQIWYKQCWCYGNFKYLSSIFVYSIAGSGNSPMYRLNGWIERTSKQGSFWFSLNFRWHGGCESLCVVYLWNMSMVDTRCAAWRDKLQSGKTTHGRNRGGGEANGEKT